MFERRLTLLALPLLTACNYGFEGGGFPAHIRTIYIAQLENETPQFDLEQRLFAELLEELPGQLGLRVAGERGADAIFRGRITRYEDVARNYRPPTGGEAATEVFAHEIQITIAAELVDLQENVIRWESSGLTGRGSYRPDAESDEVGQREAIAHLIDQIINGAQSQW